MSLLPSDDWQKNYRDSAGYILSEINRAGLESPRAIYRLVEHLQMLTKLAARAEFLAEQQRERQLYGGPPKL